MVATQSVSPEVWPLLGVALGVAATLLVEGLRQASTRRNATAEARRVVYVEWLRASDRLVGLRRPVEEPPREDRAPQVAEERRNLEDQLSHLHLLAPEDTYLAALACYGVLLSLWAGPGGEQRNRELHGVLSKKRVEFIALAKRDTGFAARGTSRLRLRAQRKG